MSLWLEPAVFPVLLDWSPQILEDTVRNLLADARSTPEKASRFCAAMERAFPEAMVEPPSRLADQLGCDPGDRHVLAAAIAAKAELIVTLNVRHFPAVVLEPLGIEAVTPDQFLCNLLDLAPGAIHCCLETIAARQRNPARTAQALLQILSRQAPTFASRCMEFQIDHP